MLGDQAECTRAQSVSRIRSESWPGPVRPAPRRARAVRLTPVVGVGVVDVLGTFPRGTDAARPQRRVEPRALLLGPLQMIATERRVAERERKVAGNRRPARRRRPRRRARNRSGSVRPVRETALAACLLAGLYLPVVATMRWFGGTPGSASGRPAYRFPWLTGLALVVVGVATLLQLTVAPGLLDDLERRRAAMLHGQVWRLGTALVVQDGGAAGAVSNLVALAIVGTAAEQVWQRRRWLAIALGAGLAGELWGLVVQPVGAGNSIADVGLAASLAVLALRRGDRTARALAAATLVSYGVLLLTADIHGGAALAGALLAAGARPRPPPAGAPSPPTPRRSRRCDP